MSAVPAASSGSGSDVSQIPQAAVEYVLAQTGINLLQRRRMEPMPIAKMEDVQKRQGGGEAVAVNGNCSQGKAQCCNQSISGKKADKLGGLLGVTDVVGAIGIDCVNLPINVIGVSGALSNTCKNTPVCCTNVTQNGLINLGCNALPIN